VRLPADGSAQQTSRTDRLARVKLMYCFADSAKRAFFFHHLKAVLPRGDGLSSDSWRGASSRFF